VLPTGDIKAALVALAAGLLPGLPLAWGVARRARWTAPSALVLAFAATLTFVGAAGVAGRLLGFGLSVAYVVALGLATLTGVLGVWWGVTATAAANTPTATSAPAAPAVAGEPRPLLLRPGWSGLALGLVAGGVALWQRPWFAYTTDTFYHLAAARSLIVTDRPMVTDPFHGTAEQTLDATSGIYHTWLALLGRLSPIEFETLFVGATALGAAVVVWAMWGLCERVSGSWWAATVATIGFAGLSLYSDFRMFGYPNRVSIGFVLVAILALTQLAEETYRPAAVALCIAGLAALGAHLGSAAFVGVVAVALVLWWAAWGILRRTEPDAWRPFLRLAVPLGLLAVAAAPFVISKLGAVSGSTIIGGEIPLKARQEALWFITDTILVVRPGAFVGGGSVAFFATAGVAIASAWRALRSGHRDMLPVAAVTSIPLLVLFDPVVASVGAAAAYYAFARIALLMNFIPWVALAWASAAAFEPGAERARRIVAGVMAAAILVSEMVVMYPLARVTWVRVEGEMRVGESYTVSESREADVRNGWGGALWDVKVAVGDEYPLVAADPETGYYLAGLAPVSIVAAPVSHSPLAIELATGKERRLDMAVLTGADTSAERRREILEKWGAEYVALSPGIENDAPAYASMLTQTDLFEPVVESRRLVLLRVLSD